MSDSELKSPPTTAITSGATKLKSPVGRLKRTAMTRYSMVAGSTPTAFFISAKPDCISATSFAGITLGRKSLKAR